MVKFVKENSTLSWGPNFTIQPFYATFKTRKISYTGLETILAWTSLWQSELIWQCDKVIMNNPCTGTIWAHPGILSIWNWTIPNQTNETVSYIFYIYAMIDFTRTDPNPNHHLNPDCSLAANVPDSTFKFKRNCCKSTPEVEAKGRIAFFRNAVGVGSFWWWILGRNLWEKTEKTWK